MLQYNIAFYGGQPPAFAANTARKGRGIATLCRH
jgi:hypothetical protein